MSLGPPYFTSGSASAAYDSDISSLLTRLPDNNQNLVLAKDVRDPIWTLWNKIELVSSQSGSFSQAISYTTATPSSVTIGGITEGMTFSNESIQGLFDLMLHPYVPTEPQLGIDAGERQFGNNGALNLSYYINVGSSPISTIAFNGPSTIPISPNLPTGNDPDTGYKLGITPTYSSSTLLTQELVFTMSITSDDLNTYSATASTIYKHKRYYGQLTIPMGFTPSIPSSVTTVRSYLTDAVIKGLSFSELSTNVYFSEYITFANQYFIFAAPTVMGEPPLQGFHMDFLFSTDYTKIKSGVTFSNEYGYLTPYDIWISNFYLNQDPVLVSAQNPNLFSNTFEIPSDIYYMVGPVGPTGYDGNDGSPVPLQRIAWGTGTGVTGSEYFTFDESTFNLLVSTGSSFSSATNSVILGGSFNNILNTPNGSIIGGVYNHLRNVDNSSITGGYNNCISYTKNSSIIGGKDGYLYNSCESTIIGGYSNNLEDSKYSSIIGGQYNIMSNNSFSSSIIGGYNNCVYNSCKSMILGGSNLSLNSENDTVYVNKLKVATASNDNGLSDILVRDSNGNVKYRDASTILTPPTAIDNTEIAFGTGTGLTSSNDFNFNSNTFNFIASTASSITGTSIKSIILGGSNNGLTGSNNGSIIGGKCNNLTNSVYGSILGGYNILINGSCESSVIGGNTNNIYSSNYSSILGGQCNGLTSSYGSVILGGFRNKLSSGYSLVSGISNKVYGWDTNIIGGVGNTASSEYSTIINSCISCNNTQNSKNSSIIGSFNSQINCCSPLATIIGSKNSKITRFSCYSSIIGGINNTLDLGYCSSIFSSRNSVMCNSRESVILGGGFNTICNNAYDGSGSILGGRCNSILASPCGSIIGGFCNRLDTQACKSTIISGNNNWINGSCQSSIIGGRNNKINSDYEISIIGGCNNLIEGGSRSVILGGSINKIDTFGAAAIVGGRGNRIYGYYSSIIGGRDNTIYSHRSSIIGGCNNTVYGYNSSIIGGLYNTIGTSSNSVILGGTNLTLNNENDTVYVPTLKIATVSNNNTLTDILVRDFDGTIRYRTFTDISHNAVFSSTNNADNRFIETASGISSNIVGHIVPIDSTIDRITYAISATGPTSSANVYINGTYSFGLTMSNLTRKATLSLTQSVLLSDEISVYISGSVSQPIVNIHMRG